MKRLIAVWGSSGSGKTTFATSLASTLYSYLRQESRVAVVYSDQNTPAISYLLPRQKKESIHSLGMTLSRPVISKTEVLKNIITVSGRKNFGVLGFIDGENIYTYPSFDTDKVMQFFEQLGDIVDYIVVDCSTDAQNPFTESVLKKSDLIFNVINPDLKSISWSASSRKLLAMNSLHKKAVTVLNHVRNDINLPEDDRLRTEGEDVVMLPYSKAISQKWFEGMLLTGSSDSSYEKAVIESVLMICKSEQESGKGIIPFIFDPEKRAEFDAERYGDAV